MVLECNMGVRMVIKYDIVSRGFLYPLSAGGTSAK